MAPHLEKEIEFEDLIERIEQALLNTYSEADCCDPPIYHIVCEEEERSYNTGSQYFVLKVIEGDDPNCKWTSAMAYLNMFDDGSAYHGGGNDKKDWLFKVFKSYAFNRTVIHNFDPDYRRKITYEDTI